MRRGRRADAFSPAIQSSEILDPRSDTLLVERPDRTLIAYAQLCRTTPPALVAGAAPIELKRFYVLHRWHGAGIAPALMKAVADRAAAAGADAMWLGVWERNPRAIRFYEKSGFVVAGEHIFQLGSDPQRDVIMTKNTGPQEKS